jgi:multidrug transporter EmrE-like cation transporter
MHGLVYILCALTSFVCAVLLWRGYRASRARLLLWSAWCFVGLTLNNVLLVVDMSMSTIDLSVIRAIPALIGVAMLVYGLVWEGE